MVGNSAKIIAASLVALGTLGVPAVASAQGYGYVNDDQPAVVVECGPGQRAVMEQRRINGRTQVVARCDGAHVQGVVYDEYGRAIQTRPVAYETYRPVARRSTVAYVERAPRRSKTKSALMIAGSAATGAGVGGALKGKKGALIGAAIGGGSASIYEAAKRR
jgi:predicted short-subunit dehydrogenase-like oxidoreductase (DUF2520 family)